MRNNNNWCCKLPIHLDISKKDLKKKTTTESYPVDKMNMSIMLDVFTFEINNKS